MVGYLSNSFTVNTGIWRNYGHHSVENFEEIMSSIVGVIMNVIISDIVIVIMRIITHDLGGAIM